MPKLIYCGGGNSRFVDIAIDAGMKYGARLPDTVYGPLYFADQDWKQPDRKSYMSALEKHSPEIATVLDLEDTEQLPLVLDWAEEACQFVKKVIIIPKVIGIIQRLPREINGREVVLGYSIKTKYGDTAVEMEEFFGWPVHLLGGSPKSQIETWTYMSKFCDIISMDGNYYRMKATRFCEHWEPPNKWIADGRKTKNNAHYKAFERSVKNLMRYWTELDVEHKK